MLSQEPKTLIVGAGPAGLSVAACLREEKVPFRLVDRYGVAGGAYSRVYEKIVLASPTRFNSLPGFPLRYPREYIPIKDLEQYFLAYADHHRLSPEKLEVERIEKNGKRFRVKMKGAQDWEEFHFVIVATGIFDFSYVPPVKGLSRTGPLEFFHSKDWKGPENFTGKRLLIVGSATSAVEIAEECVHAGLPASMSVKKKKVKILPQRFLGRDLHDSLPFFERLPRLSGSFCLGHKTFPATDLGFGKFVKEGKIKIYPEILSLERNEAVFEDGSKENFDAMVFATGYRYERPFLSFPIRYWPHTNSPLTHSQGESVSCENLYFIGTPCAIRLTSSLIRGMARDAPVIARSVAKKWEAFQKVN